MDPITMAALIGGAATLGGAGMGAMSSAKSAAATNAANERMADKQMQFQERMDSSKYQRGVADARAAGFNPLVAFPGSGGSPMGASAVMQNPSPNRGELYLSTAKAVADLASTVAEVKTKNKQSELLQTQKDALAGAVVDAENRANYGKSKIGRGTAAVKNFGGDLGGVVGSLLGMGALGSSAKIVKMVASGFPSDIKKTSGTYLGRR